MEACQPPFSARAVTSMSLTTDAGEATVTLMCDVFGISCSAYYAAKKAADTPSSARDVHSVSNGCGSNPYCVPLPHLLVSLGLVIFFRDATTWPPGLSLHVAAACTTQAHRSQRASHCFPSTHSPRSRLRASGRVRLRTCRRLVVTASR